LFIGGPAFFFTLSALFGAIVTFSCLSAGLHYVGALSAVMYLGTLERLMPLQSTGSMIFEACDSDSMGQVQSGIQRSRNMGWVK
jgi:hypothetical protein